jgi:hypothetical protein
LRGQINKLVFTSPLCDATSKKTLSVLITTRKYVATVLELIKIIHLVERFIEHLQDKEPQMLNELDVNYRRRRKKYRRKRRNCKSKNKLKCDEKNLKNFEFWVCFENLEKH